MENHIYLDNVDQYNKLMGFETKHPLVAVVDLNGTNPMAAGLEHVWHYGLYNLWLKQTYCGDITYGREPYDYQEGTVVSFAPGQVARVKLRPDYKPNSLGLLFHPDLIHGTSLGREITQYSFFNYSSREALHLSEQERSIYEECLNQIKMEIERPIDKHSKKLICRTIELLLDHCMRFYDRQFITRENVNHDVIAKFETLLNDYFSQGKAEKQGLPSVKYFAENCFLSPNYFGDLVKKQTGRSPQEFIQNKIIDLAKEELLSSTVPITEIAYLLGFQYSQHFNRYFKRSVGMSPSEYRKENAQK